MGSIACTVDHSETEPYVSESVHSSEVWFGTSGSSRATYDTDLHAEWEDTDKVKIVQGKGDYTDEKAGILDFQNFGDDHSDALFHGNVQISDSGTQFYHLVYPASTTLCVSLDKTTAVFSIPSSQSGKWVPYMYASVTSTEKGLSALSASLTPINGALAIRVFEQCDYSAPKTLKSITIRETNGKSIVGTITMDADYGESLSQSSISDGESEISSSCTEYTDGTDNSYREYRFNVIPCDEAMLEITVVDSNDEEKTFLTPSSMNLRAGKRIGINISWESPEITVGEVCSWYEAVGGRSIHSGDKVYASDGTTELNGNTIYALNISWANVPDTAEKGLVIDDVEYPGMFSVDGIAAGQHRVRAYARINSSRYFESAENTITVTPEITATLGTISSWYTESAEGAVSSTNGGVINIREGLKPTGTTASGMEAFLAAKPYSYSYTYGGNTYSSDARTNTDDSISGIASNGKCSVTGCVTLANGASILTEGQTIDVTEKFTVGFGDNALKSWFESDDDTLAGKTMYITQKITDTTKDGYDSRSRYYEYRTSSSTSWVRVSITRKNTKTNTISLSGTKIIETTTEVPGLSNGIYFVKACSILPNGTVIESSEQSIEVTDKYTVGLGDLSSWYSKFYSTGVDDSTMAGKIAISNLPTTGDGIANYASSVKVEYSGAASGSVTASMNASNTIANITGDGTYDLQAKIVLTGKRDTDGNGTKHTKTITSPSRSVSATREIWTVSMGTATSWWKEANINSTIPGNTISISGGITTNAVTSMLAEGGYKIDDSSLVAGLTAKTVTTSGGNKSYNIKSYIKIGNYFKYSSSQDLTVTEKFTLTPGAVNSWYKDANLNSTIPGRTIVATKCSTNATSDWYSSLKYEYTGAGSGTVDGSFSNNVNIGGSLTTGNYSVTAKMTLKNGVVISSSFGNVDVTPVYSVAIGTASSWYTNRTTVTSGSTILISGGLSMTPHEETYISSKTYSYSGGSTGTANASIGANNTISSLSSGDYSVSGIIKLKNGVELKTSQVNATVTKIPTVSANIKSSYNTNGSVDKKNNNWYDESNTTIGYYRKAISITDVALSNTDDFTTSKIASVTYYIDNSQVANTTWGAKADFVKADYSLGAHSNCFVRISMDNGYTNETSKYTIYVTGLPYTYSFAGKSTSDVDAEGWKRNTVSGSSATMWDNYIQLQRKYYKSESTSVCFIVTPPIYVPQNMTINYTIKHKRYCEGATANIVSYIGITTSQTQAASSHNDHTVEGSAAAGKSGMNTHNGSLSATSGTKYISVYHNNANGGFLNVSYYLVNSFTMSY